jgi:hypothetical protein
MPYNDFKMVPERQDEVRPRWRLSIDSIDFSNRAERRALIQQVLESGTAIALAEREEMIRNGIIDERGNLLITELPEDMHEGADRDFGG